MVPTDCGRKDCVFFRNSTMQRYGAVLVDFCDGEENDNQITILDSPNSCSTFFLPHLAPCLLCINRPTYDLTHLYLTVGNVPNLLAIQPYNQIFFKFYPFAEFTHNDIGTVESGLNSIVLVSNNHLVLLPLN